MFERILLRIRERVRNSQYVVTYHAREEMIDEAITAGDLEHAILGGRIVEQQRDRVTGESKYRICGPDLDPMPTIMLILEQYVGQNGGRLDSPLSRSRAAR